MLDFEEFETVALDIADTFPEDFFRELNGGVVIRRGTRIHPKAVAGDLFVLGEYRRDRHLGRFVVLYYGSFEQCFGYYRDEDLKEKIRKVLLHEFRHHLESLAGERDLEIEDAIELSRYKYRKQMQKDLTNKNDSDTMQEKDFIRKTNVCDAKTNGAIK